MWLFAKGTEGAKSYVSELRVVSWWNARKVQKILVRVLSDLMLKLTEGAKNLFQSFELCYVEIWRGARVALHGLLLEGNL